MIRSLRVPGPRRVLAVGISVLALALISGSAGAAGCWSTRGKVDLEAAPGPPCASPVGICLSGDVTGGLSGTSFSTVTSVVPTADTPTTSVVILTADTELTTSHGVLSLKDTIVSETSTGEFSELDIVVAGTGRWAGATGNVRIDGTFDGNVLTGRYIAQICPVHTTSETPNR